TTSAPARNESVPAVFFSGRFGQKMAKAWAQKAVREHPKALCHLEVPCCPLDSTVSTTRSCAPTRVKIRLIFPAPHENLRAVESWSGAAFCAEPLLRSDECARE